MRPPTQFAVLTIALFILGCRYGSRNEDPVAGMGLTETVLGRALVEKSVSLANSWLERGIGIHFMPSWKTPSGTDARDAVPVYAISELHAPANYMVAVPARCHCVFVQPRVYETWLRDHPSHSGLTLEVLEERLLAFMLIHEAGHIAYGDPGQFDSSNSGSLNTDATAEKQREESADAFAVEQLRGALTRTKDTDAWLNALNATKDLANLSFEMQQVRSEQCFGSESLHTPAAFYDVGYTHPNFELRVLTVNNLISNTETSRQLLANFQAGRAPQSSVLF